MNSPARQDFRNTDISPYPLTLNSDSSKRNTKEGQRVYKLMVETGTESIWDQFFAQPFKLDEL